MVYGSALILEGWYSSDHSRQNGVDKNVCILVCTPQEFDRLDNWEWDVRTTKWWSKQTDCMEMAHDYVLWQALILAVWNKAIYLVPGFCSDHRGTRHMSFLSPVSFWKASCHKFCHFLVEKMHDEILSTGSEEFLVHLQGPAFCALVPTTCSKVASFNADAWKEINSIQYCIVPIPLVPNKECMELYRV